MKLLPFYMWLQGCWKSWTIWFNSVLILATEYSDYLVSAVPQLSPYMPPEQFKKVILTILIASIILRFKTKTGLNEK